MTRPALTRLGHCSDCDANIAHVRAFGSQLLWWIDRLTFSLAGRLGIGPWRCVDCGKRNWFLPWTKADARMLPRDRYGDASLENIDDVAAATEGGVSIGNVLLTSESLIKSRGALDRFSEKYLIGVVERLLSGEVTVSQICRDLEASEREVQGWIKLVVERRQNNLRAEIRRLQVIADAPYLDHHEPIWESDRSSAADHRTAGRAASDFISRADAPNSHD